MVQMIREYKNYRESVEVITTLFYQQNHKVGFEKINDLLIIISNLITRVVEYQQRENLKLINDEDLNSHLTKIMLAIEKKDIVVLSDLLRFEFMEYLENSLKIK